VTVAYIGFGSNLGDPTGQIARAREAVSGLPESEEVAFSSLYRSDPMGPPDQPRYINAVMALRTRLPPFTLLNCLQKIENDQGRVRTGERWGPRTLDLDILLYGRACIRTQTLTIPHYGMAQRPFVLYPLAEIAPETLLIPGQGRLAMLLRNCPKQGVERV